MSCWRQSSASAKFNRDGQRKRRRSPVSFCRMRGRFAPNGQRRRAREDMPRLIELLDSWGGVTIAYRRRLDRFAELHAESRGSGEGARRGRAVCGVSRAARGGSRSAAAAQRRCGWRSSDSMKRAGNWCRPARKWCCRRGRFWWRRARSRIPCLAREDEAQFHSGWPLFPGGRRGGPSGEAGANRKAGSTNVLVSLRPDGRAISFFGDLHPSFSGNVVKAMGSAKRGYPVLSRILARRSPSAPAPHELVAALER